MSKFWTEETALEWDILRWGAGANVALPCEAVRDERRLMARVVTHRLGPRLLRRLKAENARPRWLSEWVLAHLRGQNAKTIAQIEMRFRTLREMCTALPDAPPLLLKGFAPYAATGNPQFLRPSGDLDLLAPAPEQFCEALRSLGYDVGAASAHAHEFATAGRGSIGIEIHRFFPVYSFPPGVENTELEPGRSSSVHFQTFAAPQRREIHYNDLWPHAIAAQAPELAGLRVPDVTTTAFILCAHEFRELIQSPFELLVPVRLALLADIYDLAIHPDFDARRFLDLARLWGDSSARVMGHFLQTVFGSSPLPYFAYSISPERLPRQIGVRGVWTSLGTAREWLMGLERSEILQRLQSNSTPDDEQETIQTFAHHLCGEPLALQLKLERTMEQFCLQLQLPPLAHSNLEYKVRLEKACSLINTASLFSSGLWEQNGHAHVMCLNEPSGSSVRWTLMPSNEPLLLTVMRRDANVHDFYNAQCIVVALITPKHTRLTAGSNDLQYITIV